MSIMVGDWAPLLPLLLPLTAEQRRLHDREHQRTVWRLEAERPRLEVRARFLLELKRRGLRPSPATFARWWRRKSWEVELTTRELDYLMKAEGFYAIVDALNQPSPLLQMFEEGRK